MHYTSHGILVYLLAIAGRYMPGCVRRHLLSPVLFGFLLTCVFFVFIILPPTHQTKRICSPRVSIRIILESRYIRIKVGRKRRDSRLKCWNSGIFVDNNYNVECSVAVSEDISLLTCPSQ